MAFWVVPSADFSATVISASPLPSVWTHLGTAVPGTSPTRVPSAVLPAVAHLSAYPRDDSCHLAGKPSLGRHREDAPGVDLRRRTHTVANVRATANPASAMR